MTVRNNVCSVTRGDDGALDLRSAWSSNVNGGEYARFEVELAEEGPFRFVVNGQRLTTVSITRRKVRDMTDASTTAQYFNSNPGPNKRLANFTFRALWKREDGTSAVREADVAKFLP